MKIKPLPGNIFAQLQNGERKLDSGIVLRDDNGKDHGIRTRWGKVWMVAEDVTSVKPGQWILCEHGRWTMTIEVKQDDGSVMKFQKIDPKGIIGVQDEEPIDDFIGLKSGVGDTGQARPEDFGAR